MKSKIGYWLKPTHCLALLICFYSMSGCNGSSETSSQATVKPEEVGFDYHLYEPYPFPPSREYPVLPNDFGYAIPSFDSQELNNHANSTKIAWGERGNPAAEELVAMIRVTNNGRSVVCSATPVAAANDGGTWLVSAAHCFVKQKNNKQKVQTGDLVSNTSVAVLRGYTKQLIASKASVYLPANYCTNATFNGIGNCPNFNAENQGVGGEGHDIALIHINAAFNSNILKYPKLATESEYPEPYTMAPVLSLGYGLTQASELGELFYVINYYYAKYDKPGYHYLLNSYFNINAKKMGYSSLVCGGDSGGGDLFWNGSHWILLATHSYGPSNGCGRTFYSLPNGATNVGFYYDWLQHIIGNPSSCQLATNCVSNQT